MKFLILTLFTLLTTTTYAQTSAGFTCVVYKLLNNADFKKKFEGSLTKDSAIEIEKTATGAHITIGDLFLESTEANVVVTNTESSVTATAKPEGGDTFRVVVYNRGPKNKTGYFFYTDAKRPETRVAQLYCAQRL
jgi:hypothetical protein